MSGKDGKIPALKGRIMEALRDAPSRDCQDEPLSPHERPLQVAFTNAKERAVAALSIFLLEQLRGAGATCVDEKTTSAMLARILSTMTDQERMQIEIEAHSIVRWIGESLAPELADHRATPARVNEQSPRREVIAWAIAHGHDLIVEHYDAKRGELVTHKLTPMALEADSYLRAISHRDKDERVFQISRLSELRPASGWQVRRTVGPIAPSPALTRPRKDHAAEPSAPTQKKHSQMSLLGEEEE